MLQRYGGEYARLIKRKRSRAANQEADRTHTVKRVLLDIATGLGPLEEARRVSKHGVASAERVAATEAMGLAMFKPRELMSSCDCQGSDRRLVLDEECAKRPPRMLTAGWRQAALDSKVGVILAQGCGQSP